jgi:hypothetical protein
MTTALTLPAQALMPVPVARRWKLPWASGRGNGSPSPQVIKSISAGSSQVIHAAPVGAVSCLGLLPILCSGPPGEALSPTSCLLLRLRCMQLIHKATTLCRSQGGRARMEAEEGLTEEHVRFEALYGMGEDEPMSFLLKVRPDVPSERTLTHIPYSVAYSLFGVITLKSGSSLGAKSCRLALPPVSCLANKYVAAETQKDVAYSVRQAHLISSLAQNPSKPPLLATLELNNSFLLLAANGRSGTRRCCWTAGGTPNSANPRSSPCFESSPRSTWC